MKRCLIIVKLSYRGRETIVPYVWKIEKFTNSLSYSLWFKYSELIHGFHNYDHTLKSTIIDMIINPMFICLGMISDMWHITHWKFLVLMKPKPYYYQR